MVEILRLAGLHGNIYDNSNATLSFVLNILRGLRLTQVHPFKPFFENKNCTSPILNMRLTGPIRLLQLNPGHNGKELVRSLLRVAPPVLVNFREF